MSRVGGVATNRLYLSAVGVATVLVVCVVYLFAAVLDRPLTSRPIQVDVELPATGGLFEGSVVTYRGVKVGKVTEIDLDGSGAVARLRLDSGIEVPRESRAVVRSLSPVGEQYLDFQPSSADGPFLADGATVAATATDVPKSLSSTVVAVNEVLRQVDERKLRRVLVELATGLDGAGDELGRLIDDGQLLLAELDRIRPQTERLLRNSDQVLEIGPDRAGAIRGFGRDAKQLAAFLRDYDPELRGTLERAPEQLAQLEALVEDAAGALPDFLTVGGSITEVFASYEPHVRMTLQKYASGLGVLADAMTEDELRIQLILDADPRCRYSGVTVRDPHKPGRHAFRKDGRCAASFSRLQRGAAHAPGPVR